jgi:hypothetical protein
VLAFLAAGCLLLQSEGWPELLRQLDDDDPARRDAASRAIRRLGPRILPDLERAMGDASPEVRCRLSDLRNRLPEVRLRSILQNPGYVEVRRRWNAVIDAVVWKRPLPAALWLELAAEKTELRELEDPRPHAPAEILAKLRECAAQILRQLVWEVGVEGMDPELSGGGMQGAVVFHDFLPVVLQAEPDPVSFEEVYGTLMSLQFEWRPPLWNYWDPEDLQTAVRILVQIRRRTDREPVSPALSRDEALKLASRGPLVRGIADAVGRSIANRRQVARHSSQDLMEGKTDAEPSGLRDVYDVLIWLNVEIGHRYCSMDLLRPAQREIPEGVLPVADRNRGLFDLARSPESGDAVERVVRDLLHNCHFTNWKPEQLGTAAGLLRAIGTRLVEESR